MQKLIEVCACDFNEPDLKNREPLSIRIESVQCSTVFNRRTLHRLNKQDTKLG